MGLEFEKVEQAVRLPLPQQAASDGTLPSPDFVALTPQYAAWLTAQRDAFQAAMDGAPLETSLGILIRAAVEQAGDGRRCAFYIANSAATELRHVVGMSEGYARCVEGFKISPESLSCGLAVATGEPVLTRDVHSEPRWQDWRWMARDHAFSGCWSFPVQTATGRIVGSFAMYFEEPREATPFDLALAGAFSQTASIIISRHQESEERVRIDSALRHADANLAAELAAAEELQAISTELLGATDVHGLYDRIVAAAASIMRSDAASLQVLRPERGQGGELQLLATLGFTADAVRFWEWVRIDSGCSCGEAMRTGRRAVAEDIETCAFMTGTPDRTAYVDAGIRAVQSTPLVTRSGAIVGMISTHWRRPHTPSANALRRFDVLARQAADLVERATIEEVLRERERQLAQEVGDMQRLHDFSRKLLEQDDVKLVMRDVLASISDLLGVSKASIQLCDESMRRLHLIGTIGFDAAFDEAFKFVDIGGFTTCAAALGRRERVIVENLSADSSFEAFARLAGHYGIEAAQSTPLLDRSGAVIAMLTTYFDRPYRPSQRDLRLMDLYLELAARHIERKQAENSLSRSEARFRAFVTSSVDAMYRMSADWSEMQHLDGKNFIVDTLEPSRAWLDIYVEPEDQRRLLDAIAQAVRTKSTFEAEHRVRRADGSMGWTLSRATPVLDDAGQIQEWFGTASDVTARKQDEERRELLLNELNHRVKNTLATVQSVAMQTLRNSRDTEHAREQFDARLMALSKAHDILTQESWEGATLAQIVHEAVRPYRGGAEDRFTIEGPSIWLSAKQALALSMALHELCTNAVKYGALSNEDGRVAVRWAIVGEDEDAELQMVWEESGGPAVARPTHSGFGSRLIERGLRQDLKGRVTLEFEPSGVICSINAPHGGGRGR